MSLPVTVPALSIEILALHLSDTAPTPTTGYEIVEIKDLGYTKLWQEFKVITGT